MLKLSEQLHVSRSRSSSMGGQDLRLRRSTRQSARLVEGGQDGPWILPATDGLSDSSMSSTVSVVPMADKLKKFTLEYNEKKDNWPGGLVSR
jgi:hypothetical protein